MSHSVLNEVGVTAPSGACYATFSLNERIRLRTLQQCAAQALHFAESAHAEKSTGCFMQGRTDPTKQHVTILPALHVSRVVANQAVQVFDRIGAPARFVERTVDAEPGDGESLIEGAATLTLIVQHSSGHRH